MILAMLAAAAAAVASPDGRIRFELSPGFEYAVFLKGKTVIEASPLGMVVDGQNLADGAQAGQSVRRRVRQTFDGNGNRSTVVSECNELAVPVRGKTPYALEVRACNDGVAFRHRVPGTGARTPDEATSFRLPAGSVVWYHDTEGHYEALHKRKAIQEISAGDWAAPPVTVRLPGGAGYAAITEGALYRYAGMVLQADGKGGFAARLGHAAPPSYPFRLRYAAEVERMAKPASVEGEITTPWRVILIGADLNELVNATLVQSVAPGPDAKVFPQGARTEWVKPGRAVWKYLDGGDNDQATVREFSRLASQLGFEYQVVEGYWQKWPKEELKAIIAESKRQGVGLWLWKHSNQLRKPAERQAFFDLCQEVGAAGVKIDFFDHEAKEVVELYEMMLREAATRKLLVNFHGANKPTGEARTWPNELTREAVRGMESRRSNRARHDATLPFTRLLCGAADYTPVHFGERRNDTTWAHQLATAVIMTSPLLTYGAHPKTLVEHPAVELIKSIPAVWDETRVLAGSEIGEAAVLARRRGEEWFVAIVNGETARTLDVQLTFLGAGVYRAGLMRDDATHPAAVKLEDVAVRKGARLAVQMPAGGGFVARIKK